MLRTINSPSDASGVNVDRRLIPILARVLDLGRGPQGLVRWVQDRVADAPSGPGRTSVLNQLAGELTVEIRRGAWAGTVLDYNRTMAPN
ncbi:MAG TPA: hypothetical protein VM597_29325 [Gemmataceae bacterium]|jgi:hypothetical protein|nr:hypothetical protein [Gemmataceae bacterium]